MGLTLENLNSFDNGHTLLELNIEGNWYLFDPTFSSWITHKGKRLNLVEASSLLKSGSTNIELAPALKPNGDQLGAYAPRTLRKAPRFESSLYFESQYFFPGSDLVSWYKRVLQLPAIHDGESWVFGFETEMEADRISAYSPSYSAIPVGKLIEGFYQS